MCRTLPKQIQNINSNEVSSDQFLGVIIDPNNSNQSLWLNGKVVEFKLDTGADVSVIPSQLFESLKIDAMQPTELT